jgi:hypothetical protein
MYSAQFTADGVLLRGSSADRMSDAGGDLMLVTSLMLVEDLILG